MQRNVTHVMTAALAAVLMTAMAGTASAQKKYDTGASDTEIKIGNIMNRILQTAIDECIIGFCCIGMSPMAIAKMPIRKSLGGDGVHLWGPSYHKGTRLDPHMRRNSAASDFPNGADSAAPALAIRISIGCRAAAVAIAAFTAV